VRAEVSFTVIFDEVTLTLCNIVDPPLVNLLPCSENALPPVLSKLQIQPINVNALTQSQDWCAQLG
jgi:hypothetical protein